MNKKHLKYISTIVAGLIYFSLLYSWIRGRKEVYVEITADVWENEGGSVN
jgi:hypothetical protein